MGGIAVISEEILFPLRFIEQIVIKLHESRAYGCLGVALIVSKEVFKIRNDFSVVV